MIFMEKLERRKEKITQKGNLLVAFSGGVDSGLLLKVAHDVLETVSMKLKTLGFNYVTLDLEGYRSGSMDLGEPQT